MTDFSLKNTLKSNNVVLAYSGHLHSQKTSKEHGFQDKQTANSTKCNIIPFRQKYTPSLSQSTPHRIQIDTAHIKHTLPEFIQEIMTNVRPQFPEFILHFSHGLQGIQITIMHYDLSNTTKQRLAFLDQAIKRTLQTIVNIQKKKTLR